MKFMSGPLWKWEEVVAPKEMFISLFLLNTSFMAPRNKEWFTEAPYNSIYAYLFCLLRRLFMIHRLFPVQLNPFKCMMFDQSWYFKCTIKKQEMTKRRMTHAQW